MQKITLIVLSLVVSNFAFSGTTTKKTAKTSTTTTQSVHTTQAATAAAPVATSSAGNAFTNEIFTNLTTGSLDIEKGCKSCDSSTTISLSAAYFRHIQDKIQAGVEGGLSSVSAGNSNTYFNLAGVGVYNFDNNFSNSFYAKAGLGIFTVPAGTSTETKIGLFVGGGKRFAWLSNVNFTPEVRLVKKGDLDVGIEATLVNFAIHWN